MIEVRIPKEIRDFKEKIFFGLTLRQSIFTAITLAICVPLYIWGSDYIVEDTLTWIILLISLPLLSLGFVRYNQLNFEQLFIVFIKMQFYPQKRLYTQKDIYQLIRRDVLNEENKYKKKLCFGKRSRQGKTKIRKTQENKEIQG